MPADTEPRPEIQLLGEMQVVRDGEARPLPPSRKTRGLLAFLALDPRRHRRDALCNLLWDEPNDPRAALRWSLSKLRPLLDGEHVSPLDADRNSIVLDRDRVSIDIVTLRSAMSADRDALHDADLVGFEQQCARPYLEGLDDAGSAEFHLWLESEREAKRRLHCEIIDTLCARESVPREARLTLLRRRLSLDPLHDETNIEYMRESLQSEGLTAARSAFDTLRKRYASERRSDSGLVSAWFELTQSTTSGSAPDEVDDSLASTHRIVSPAGIEPGATPASPDKPSVAILGFDDIGSHPEGSVLAQGLAVDLNTQLAQLSNLFVIARASSARLTEQRLAPREIGRRLGVRYLVAGSTQRQEKRVRATVTLLDALDESEIWSEHFDRPLEDLFAVQDEIANAVVAAIEPAIERAEMGRALIKPPESLSAWEAFHRGLWHTFRFTADDNEQGNRFFQQALEIDPHFSRAHAGISFTHYSRAFLDAVPDVEMEIHKALESAQKSVGFDGRDAMGHWSLARALFLAKQHDESLAAVDRALSINPNYAQGHYARGYVGLHSGGDEDSLASLDTAQKLSPCDPLLFAFTASRAIWFSNFGRYDEAAAWAVRATHEPNAHFHIYAVAAAILELNGRSEEARNNASWVLKRHPGYSIDVYRRSFPFKDEAQRQDLMDAAERAGIPRHTRTRAT